MSISNFSKSVLVTLVVCLFVKSIHAQETFLFKPNWKVGDIKRVSNRIKTIKYNSDTLTSIEIDSNNYSLRILSEDKTQYTIALIYPNIALEAVEGWHNNISRDLKDYDEITVKYTVNKQSAETKLIDWTRTRQDMDESITKINEFLSKQDDEDASFAKSMLKLYAGMFSTEERVKSYAETDLYDLLIPFNRPFVEGKEITQTDSTTSPINKNQSLSATTKTKLTAVDKKTTSCQIDLEVVYDMSDFKRMMAEMMKKFSRMFKADKETTDKKSKEIAKFDIDMIQTITYNFDYNTNWITAITKTGQVTGADPKKGNYKRQVISKIIVK